MSSGHSLPFRDRPCLSWCFRWGSVLLSVSTAPPFFTQSIWHRASLASTMLLRLPKMSSHFQPLLTLIHALVDTSGSYTVSPFRLLLLHVTPLGPTLLHASVMRLNLLSKLHIKDSVTWFSIRNCKFVASIESHGYIDSTPPPTPPHSICLSVSLSLSPFTVMEYFIDILGVWGSAMTLQLFHPFKMH